MLIQPVVKIRIKIVESFSRITNITEQCGKNITRATNFFTIKPKDLNIWLMGIFICNLNGTIRYFLSSYCTFILRFSMRSTLNNQQVQFYLFSIKELNYVHISKRLSLSSDLLVLLHCSQLILDLVPVESVNRSYSFKEQFQFESLKHDLEESLRSALILYVRSFRSGKRHRPTLQIR